jgi:hypothetical protein
MKERPGTEAESSHTCVRGSVPGRHVPQVFIVWMLNFFALSFRGLTLQIYQAVWLLVHSDVLYQLLGLYLLL